MSAERLIEAAKPFLKKEGLADAPKSKLIAAAKLEIEKTKLLSDVPRLVDFFFKEAAYDGKAVDKVLKAPGADKVLEDIAPHLKRVSPWDEKNLEKEIRAFCEKKGLSPG